MRVLQVGVKWFRQEDCSFMKISKTGVILNTENYPQCVEFYRDILGLTVLFAKDEPNEQLTCLDMGGVYLMVEPGGRANEQPKDIKDCPTKFRFNTPNIEAASEHLNQHGIAVEVRRHSWGTTAEFCDPDGNRCAFRSDAEFGT